MKFYKIFMMNVSNHIVCTWKAQEYIDCSIFTKEVPFKKLFLYSDFNFFLYVKYSYKF